MSAQSCWMVIGVLVDVMQESVRLMEQGEHAQAGAFMRDAAARIDLEGARGEDPADIPGEVKFLRQALLDAGRRMAQLERQNQELGGALAESGVQLAHFARANEALANERDGLLQRVADLQEVTMRATCERCGAKCVSSPCGACAFFDGGHRSGDAG